MKKPLPGDFGLSKTQGHLGIALSFLQFIIGYPSPWTHAFIVLDDETILEAQPGGAQINPLSKYLGKAIFSNITLTDEQRANIVDIARQLKGTPYSFLDYFALGLERLNIKPTWLSEHIADKGNMICSQLVDYVYKKAGVHLFNDNRESQNVVPGDLANRLLEADWIE